MKSQRKSVRNWAMSTNSHLNFFGGKWQQSTPNLPLWPRIGGARSGPLANGPFADVGRQCDYPMFRFWGEELNRRKLIGAIAFCALLIFGWVSQSESALSQDNWSIGWKLGFGVAVCAAFLVTFYDKKNFPKKLWDPNPKRGLLYFLLGWLIFPVMIGVKAISGNDLDLTEMVLITLGMSALIGIAGTFTENVGI